MLLTVTVPASLIVALIETGKAPFVEVGDKLNAVTNGPVSVGGADGPVDKKVNMPPMPAVLLLCNCMLASYRANFVPLGVEAGIVIMVSKVWPVAIVSATILCEYA